jgi:PleD family two-component response regulator
MARVPEEAFPEGTEIVRVYLAGSLGEAQAVEQALDAAGVDYAAVPEQYGAPSALGARVRTGVGLWVQEARLDDAAGALERAGLTAGLVKR